MTKLVREYLTEKFTQDSDPVKDLGIGHTKYRTIKKPQWHFTILQYQKFKRNIFGKLVEKWYFVPLPLDSKRKEYLSNNYDESIKDEANYYFVTYDFEQFIKKWPFIDDYLKWVKEEENKYKQQEREEERRRKEGDVKYLN